MAKKANKDSVKPAKKSSKGEAAEKEKKEVLTPEVLPKEPPADSAALALRKPDDLSALERIETSIQRDIVLSGNLDKAGAMVGIKIGLALQSGKALLKHGGYEGWVQAKFGETFSERKAQYFAKLATAFLRSDEGAALQLPPPKDAGNWLVVADDGSELQKSVASFVGDLTLGELLDKHGVRPSKAKGGWRPADWLVSQYQSENPALKNKAFEVWPKEAQEAFKLWQDKQVDGDDAATKRMAAEGSWQTIRRLLSEQGLGRKSFLLIPTAQLEETNGIMIEVGKMIKKAITKEG